jgi:carotenoid cleavage dioxygenase
MTTPFPDHPYLTGYFTPFGAELDAPDLVVIGDLPKDLVGTFYRNGPDPLHPPREGDKYHPFDGDGMIYAFHFENGRVSMRNRWVRTKKFEQEKAAGRRLYGVFGNPMKSDPSINFADYNTANTHIWPHGDQLWALMEGCPPVELDPRTLDTKGSQTFEGAVTGPFTAHPKTDPASGALYAFGHGAKGPASTAVRYNVVDKAGHLTRTAWFDQPYASMMHDFVITERFAMFPCLPVTIDLMRAMQGKPLAAWEKDKPSYFGIMARDGDATDIRWIEAPTTFTFHFANAREDGDAIVAEAVISPRAPLMPNADGTLPTNEDTRFRLGRWTVRKNGSGPSFKEEMLDDMDIQFPRIDDRANGRSYRYVYANGSTSEMAGRTEGFDALVRYDLTTGQRDTYLAGKGCYCGEPVFVARPGSTAEGDGYLMSLVWHEPSNTSELRVLDAQNLSAGPIARIKAPARIPGGFHCHWRPGA